MATLEGGTPDPVDVQVGQQISRRRDQLGLSQTQLANAVGVSFQQVQKYETATNRVSASRLYRIATFLQTPISYFFDGLPLPESGQLPARGRAKSRQRLRIEKLARSPIGTRATFSYGSFSSTKSASLMVKAVGRPGWAKIKVGLRGTTITKVGEP